MKNLFILLVLMSSISSFASTAKLDAGEYRFSVTYNKEKFSPVIRAANEYEAIEKMAQTCFNHFYKGKNVDMEEGREIINVCANADRI